MKNSISFLSFFIVIFIAISACDSNTEGVAGNRTKSDNSNTKISGTIKNAYGLNAVFQELHLNQPDIKTLDSVVFSPEGTFTIEVPGGLKQGFYGIKLGQGYFIFVSDGSEKNITIDGDLQTLGKYQYTIDGSADSKTFATTMQSVINGEKNANTVKDELIAMKNPYLSMLLSMQIFRNNPEHINAYKAISTYANAQIKNSNDVAAFTNMVAMLSNPPPANLPDRSQNQGPQLNVAPGQVAPDIAMQDPQGKTRSLSSLRGKVVLVDFWASWCRPCRAANPHVVDLYNKYKNKGFTVFSVSLDRENGKDKWIQAIKDDGLIWENHVSDLKFWSSEAARTYGINSIPQTLLVDKSGKIAAIIPQGVSPESYIVAALTK